MAGMQRHDRRISLFSIVFGTKGKIMKKFIALLLIFSSIAKAVDVKISALPLAAPAGTHASDSFPYVDGVSNVTKRLNIFDIANLPPLVSVFAPKISPIFSGPVNVTGNLIVTGAVSGSNLSGNLTDAGADGITVTSGSGAVIGLGTSFAQHVSDIAHAGYLNAADWATFNGKQAAGNYVIATGGGNILLVNGTVSAPGLAFTSSTNTGLYSSGANLLDFAVNGAQVLDAVKSLGGFGNLGMGGAASTSDGYPLLIQRSNASAGTYLQISNPNTAINSKATFQLAADNGANNGEVSLFNSATTLDAYANAMTVRPAGSTGKLSLIGGDLTTGFIDFHVAGDYAATGEALRVNADKSMQFMQEILTPVSPSAASDKIYFKSDHNAYQLSPAGVEVKLSGGGGTTSPLTTKGDLYGFSTVNARIPIGADNQAPIADSTNPNGLTYQYSGVKNYVSNSAFESNTVTNWGLGNVALTNGLPSGSPTFGSGANVALSIASSATTPVSGTYSMAYASSAATTAGNFVASNAFTIDSSDQAKMLSWSLNYKVTAGAANLNFSGTSSNSYGVAIYDVTNSSFIPTYGAFNLVSSPQGSASGTFQSSSNGTSYRIIFYNASASLGAATILLDDFKVSPQGNGSSGPAMSDWVAYNPTFNNFGTVSAISMYSRRAGDSLEIQGAFTLGTTVAANANISLGYNGANSNVTIDTTKILNGTSLVGTATSTAANATTFGWTVLAAGANSFVNFGTQTSTLSGANLTTGTNLGSTGQTWSVYAKVPIVGWSSNTVQSSDSLNRVVSSQYSTLSSTTITSGVALAFTTVVYDKTGSLSGGNIFTAPTTGIYRVGYSGTFTTAAAINLNVYVNGVSRVASIVTLNSTARLSATAEVSVNAGDFISLVPGVTGVAGDTNANFTITMNQGPAVVQQSESVSASYSASGAISWTATGGANFDTKIDDSHGAVTTGANAWSFKAPVSGKYMVKLTAAATTSTSAVALYKNGVLYKYLFRFVSAAGNIVSGGADVRLNAGDTIDARLDASTFTGDSNANGNNIYIVRVGN